MLSRYVWRDLVRNPRRTLATMVGVTLGVGLFSAVLFFVDGSSASMTQRAVAPLPIDMQRVLTAPLGDGLRLTETVHTSGPVPSGQSIVVQLGLSNSGAVPANEVVLRSGLPAGATYIPGSATLDGKPLADNGTDTPLAAGDAKTGVNLGTVAPGQTIEATYDVVVNASITSVDALHFQSSFSSREVVVPVAANAPEPLGLHDLATRIAALDGVASADELSFVDLPPGSLAAGSASKTGPVRLFGFDSAYRERYRDIHLVSGSQVPGEALISSEAAQALKVGVGDSVAVRLPGAPQPIEMRISGIADLSRARALFESRKGENLEDFLYTRDSIVIDPQMFADTVVSAFQSATTTRGDLLKSVPILEIDVRVIRSRLNADPASALAQTARIGADVTAIAKGQDYLLDNISNTLHVARDDAAVAKRMFIFLGIPGGLLAAMLAAYAGSVLAGAQRREQAILRIRGANRRHLLRMLALRTLLLTAAGSLIGVGIGLSSAAVVLGSTAMGRASTTSLIASGLAALTIGFLATGGALYLAGRRSISREINEDRARLQSRPPLWRRARLDLIGVATVSVATIIAIRSDAFAGTAGSVYNGRGVHLTLGLLVLPLGAWIAGGLVLARIVAFGTRHLRDSGGQPFSKLVWGLFSRSVRRRPWATADGMFVVALIVGLGTCVTSFAASYDAAKSADARFSLGSDVRVTPSPTSTRNFDVAYSDALHVDGIAAVTPVVFSLQNSVLQSERNGDAANVAAVDPASFVAVAPFDGSTFVNMTPEAALASLSKDRTGVFLSTKMADFLSLQVGAPVQVLFGKGSDKQIMSSMHVIGLFERLPAFPEGAQALINISQQESLAATSPNFYLARTLDSSPTTLRHAVTNLRAGPGSIDSLQIDTRETALDKDQSSLAALNIHGLLTLDSSYALAMGVVAIAIFVFGLLLQRRREYVTMRAQGVHAREIRTLIVAETGGVAITGSIAGVVVGIAMAFFFVNILRPLFVLAPSFELPINKIIIMTALVITATAATSIAATSLINRLKPTDLLRDE